MRLFGLVLLIGGFLLCVSIVWAALGFLMMGLGLICLLIAERSRNRRISRADVSDLAASLDIDATPEPDTFFTKQPPGVFLEPAFAAASEAADPQVDVSDLPVSEVDWSLPVETAAAPPSLVTRPWEFDSTHALRADRVPVRSEPELPDFVHYAERDPIKPSLPSPPPLPAHSAPAEAVVPPIVVEPRPTGKGKAERGVLFDDSDDLADLFNKFDLGKD
jgi:hypothetical protein